MLALKCHKNLLLPAQVSCAEITFKVNLCADENNQADMKGKHSSQVQPFTLLNSASCVTKACDFIPKCFGKKRCEFGHFCD